MSVVERAGGAVREVAEELRARHKKSVRPAAETAATFDIDFARLKGLGIYTPDGQSTQLAMELRAIKRRLLRRIGFLRESGGRTMLRASGRQKNLIMVTSTSAGEGKTFSALNLAMSLAIEDKIDTLLVDADVQRPKVLSRFGLPAAPGVTDKLQNPSLSTESLYLRANSFPLTILPQGAHVERPVDLFGSSASKSLWAELSVAKPDRLVIIDAPPVLATTEAVILAKFVDEIVFVVEAGETPEPAIASALDELLDINSNISLMLNRCLIGAGGSHYGSYEYYDRREDGVKVAGRDNKRDRED